MAILRCAFAFLLAGGAACERPPAFMARDVSSSCRRTSRQSTAYRAVVADRGPTDAQIVVQRKLATGPSFVGPPKAMLAAGATSWVDTDAAPGIAYDYFVERTLAESSWQSAGFLRAGIGLPLVEDRGRIALVIEDAVLASLSGESLAWTRIFAETDGPGARARPRVASPPEVKETIRGALRAAPDRLRQVLLFGIAGSPCLPGNITPDHHVSPDRERADPQHLGAWPADIYYADMVGRWTDTMWTPARTSIRPLIRSTSTSRATATSTRRSATTDDGPRAAPAASRPERRGASRWRSAASISRNCRGLLARREIDLLRAYLDRDHRFRRGQLIGERFAVVTIISPIRSDAKLGRRRFARSWLSQPIRWRRAVRPGGGEVGMAG